MQFVAKDLLTLELDGTPEDSSTTPVPERAFLAGDMAAESLRTSGRLRLRVRGESMLPTLWPGDVVEIVRCTIDEVRAGEIVLAVRDGRFFLHRFAGRLHAGGFLLRGDSMPAADPEFSGAALVGRLAGSTRPLSLWSCVLGRILCYCGPARRLALKVHARRRPSQKPIDAIAVAEAGADLAPARGPECPRHTICSPAISELPRAGA